jgi:hypothetical protein
LFFLAACFFSSTIYRIKQKLWSSGRALGSRLESRGFDSLPMLDGSGVKATPESIPTPNSGSLQKNKKNTGSQMGHTKKILKKTNNLSYYIYGSGLKHAAHGPHAAPERIQCGPRTSKNSAVFFKFIDYLPICSTLFSF